MYMHAAVWCVMVVAVVWLQELYLNDNALLELPPQLTALSTLRHL